MKRRSLFIFVSIFVFTGLSIAQSRTVTNADLDKYKDQRVRAETDLRENYARLGFPSPEEMERREAETTARRDALVERLIQQRLEQERVNAQIRAAEAAMAAAQPQTIVVQSGYESGYGDTGYFLPLQYGYGNGYGKWYRPRVQFGNRGFRVQQEGYFAGGQFWPTGPRTAPAPLLQVGRPRR